MSQSHPRRERGQLEHQVPAVRGRRARPAAPPAAGADRGDRHPAAPARKRRRARRLSKKAGRPAKLPTCRLRSRRSSASSASRLGGRLPAVVGHRVVHGGPDYSEPTIIDERVLDPPAALSFRWLRCTSPTTSRRSAPSWSVSRMCCRSPVSTRHSIAAIPRSPTVLQSLKRSTPKACAATDFTACLTSTSLDGCREVAPGLAKGPRRRRAPRQRRLDVRTRRREEASKARWASPRSTDCRWVRARASSMPASCST